MVIKIPPLMHEDAVELVPCGAANTPCDSSTSDTTMLAFILPDPQCRRRQQQEIEQRVRRVRVYG